MAHAALFQQEALPELKALERFAYRLCRDAQNARDLVQETMLKAYTHFEAYREGSDCRAWLFQICKNSYINEFRKRVRRPLPVDFQDETGGVWMRDDFRDRLVVQSLLQDTSDLASHGNGLSDEIHSALQKLPDTQRTVVILCDIEGHPYEEIAELLEIPIGTVRSRLHRGRKILSSLLGGRSPSGPTVFATAELTAVRDHQV